MSYFVPYGKHIDPRKPISTPVNDNPKRSLYEELIDVFFPEKNRTQHFIDRLNQESFPMTADSSELDHTYVVHVPEGTKEEGISIDTSDDKKEIRVSISVRREDEDFHAEETMQYNWKSNRVIDVEHMESYLDKKNNQLVVYSPYVVEEHDENQKDNNDIKGIVEIPVNTGKEKYEKEHTGEDAEPNNDA